MDFGIVRYNLLFFFPGAWVTTHWVSKGEGGTEVKGQEIYTKHPSIHPINPQSSLICIKIRSQLASNSSEINKYIYRRLYLGRFARSVRFVLLSDYW